MEQYNQNEEHYPANQESSGPPAEPKNLEFGEEIKKLLATAGTLELTQAQIDILFAPVQDNEVSLKPDGPIYLSWTKYSTRLTKSFPGAWVMLPEGMPKILNNVVVWGFHLIIKGTYCGFAFGEQNYYDNKRMTYPEACEGAKSNALMRLCKGLGISLELWEKPFINKWLSKYAEFKWERDKNNKDVKKWFMKKDAFGPDTANTQSQNQGPAQNTNNSNQNQNTGQNQNQQQGNTVQNQNVNQNQNGTSQEQTQWQQKNIVSDNKGPGSNIIKPNPEPAAEKKEVLHAKIVSTPQSAKKEKIPGKNQTIKTEEIIPMEQIQETEMEPVIPLQNNDVDVVAKYKSQLEEANSLPTLEQIYLSIKLAFKNEELTAEQAETLRVVGNECYRKLANGAY